MLPFEIFPSKLATISLLVLLVGAPTTNAAINRWTPFNNGLNGATVTNIVIDPQSPEILYATTFYGGVYKTTDGGQTWRALLSSQPGFFISSLVVDARNSSVLRYGSTFGISKSHDGGETWTVEEFDGGDIAEIVADSRNNNILYAVNSSGVFTSTDGGDHWQQIAIGFSDEEEESELPALDGFPRALAIDPTDSRRLYVATHYGVRTSRDRGVSWQALPLSPGVSRLSAIVVDPFNPARILLTASYGVRVSEDSGQSWSWYSVDESDVHDLVFHPRQRDVVYAAAESGVFISRNGGRTWSLYGDAFYTPTCLAFDPRSSAIYAGFDGGVKKLTDSCCEMEDISQGFFNYGIDHLARDPSNPSRLLFSSYLGVYASDNRGQNWRSVQQGLGTYNISHLYFHHEDSAIVYGTTVPFERPILPFMVKSLDNGMTWEPSFHSPRGSLWIEDFLIDPRNPNRLYLITEAPRILRSDDGGETWLEDGLGILQDYGYHSSTFDPHDPQKIYIKTRKNVYKRESINDPWISIFENQDVSDLFSFAIDPQTPGTLYVGGDSLAPGPEYRFDGLIYKSTDDGESWERILEKSDLSSVWNIAIDPRDPEIVYAAGFGVIKSTDGGSSWTSIGSELPRILITSLDIDPIEPTSLLVSNYGYGVWKLTQAIDLDVHIAQSAEHILIGSGEHPVIYQTTVSNQGMLDAHDISVAVEIDVPANVEIRGIEASGLSSYENGSWSIDRLAVGESIDLIVRLRVLDSAPAGRDIISLTSRVEHVDESDPTPGNNTASASVSILRLRW